MRIKSSEVFKDSPRQVLKRQIASGDMVCVICKERTAQFITASMHPCCESDARRCPGFHNHLSKIFKKSYADHPEYVEQQRQIGLEVQNRPEVAEAKATAMSILHHGECDKCLEYQENFKAAHLKRRGLAHKIVDRKETE
jgi:hypothetical protein